MKSIEQVNNDIFDQENTIRDKRAIGKNTKILRNKLTLLRSCKMYLETAPNEEFVKSEVERVADLIKKTTPDFPAAFTPKTISKVLKRLGVDKMKKQLSTLKYILK